MKKLLAVKFIVLYLVLGVMSVFITLTLGRQMLSDRMTARQAQLLYREAAAIAQDTSAGSFFSVSYDLQSLYRSLRTMADAQNAQILIIDTEGNLLIDTAKPFSAAGMGAIEQFDYAGFGPRYYEISSFFRFFGDDHLNVMRPIVSGMSTKGYVSVHMPVSQFHAMLDSYVSIMLLIVLIVYFTGFAMIILLINSVIQPLRKIRAGAVEMAAGHLDHRIEVSSEDEIGDVAASMNRMAENLQQTGETQKKFISNISHDFRSPLTSIKGFTEAIIDGTIPPENQEKYLRIIASEVERLENLSSDTLTLSKLDSRDQPLNLSDLDINSTIRNTAAVFEGICRKEKISFNLILLGDALYVRADLARIQQVLYNLIDNAVKFSPPESTITIETSIRHGKAEVRIRDEGIGIKKEDLDKIWDRFFKADTSRGKDKMGTGLGLAIVREIIRLHDQTIEVTSREGRGTEFWFTLELAKGRK